MENLYALAYLRGVPSGRFGISLTRLLKLTIRRRRTSYLSRHRKNKKELKIKNKKLKIKRLFLSSIP